LFSILASRIGTFEGLRVADLFAGSGALGLEALSRGAGFCLFVDSDAKAAATIRKNIGVFGAQTRSEIRAQSVTTTPPPSKPFDLILLDPPYRSGLAQPALAHVADPFWLAAGGLVSIETDGTPIELPPGLAIETERRFGKAHLLLARRTT
jgi:16S rRNA (guanine966-N2)-methyltransferase